MYGVGAIFVGAGRTLLTELWYLTVLLCIVLRHDEPILGVIRSVVRAGEAIASHREAVKLEGLCVLQANVLQDPSRGIIVYQGCRHDALQLEVLKAIA